MINPSSTLNNCGRSRNCVRGAASQIDFYLPPPDDRAFRRGKIQRLRDQITAWRRRAKRCGDYPAALSTEEAVTMELPLWRSTVASPTSRGASRHEKMLILSSVTGGDSLHRETSLPYVQGRHQHTLTHSPSNTKNNSMAVTKNTNTIGRVTEVPYFHDYALFCVPNENTLTAKGNMTRTPSSIFSPLTDEVHVQLKERDVDICCGVTTNKMEMTHHAEHFNYLRGLHSGEEGTMGRDSARGGRKFFSFSSLTAPCNMKTGSETVRRRSHTIDSLFLAKTQSVELAMAVHTEHTRRQMSMNWQHPFSRTMEVPIDWTEFERLPLCNTTSPSPPPVTEEEEERVNSHLTTTVGCRPSSQAIRVGSHRGPIRLYTIRMRRCKTNLNGLMDRATDIPRHGVQVNVPESWVE